MATVGVGPGDVSRRWWPLGCAGEEGYASGYSRARKSLTVLLVRFLLSSYFVDDLVDLVQGHGLALWRLLHKRSHARSHTVFRDHLRAVPLTPHRYSTAFLVWCHKCNMTCICGWPLRECGLLTLSTIHSMIAPPSQIAPGDSMDERRQCSVPPSAPLVQIGDCPHHGLDAHHPANRISTGLFAIVLGNPNGCSLSPQQRC